MKHAKPPKPEEAGPSDDAGLNEGLMKKATSGLSKIKGGKLHMHIHQADDKKFIVEHDFRGGQEPMQERTEHAPSTLEELLDHVKQHYTPSEE